MTATFITKGDKGDTGAQGPAGPTGPTGPTGPAGTPGISRLQDFTDVDTTTATQDKAVFIYNQTTGKFEGQAQLTLPYDAKGDLLVATAADTVAKVSVTGVNGRTLQEDSTAPTGVAFKDSPGGMIPWTLATGDYLRSPAGTVSTIAGSNGIVNWVRVLVPATMTFDRIAVHTTVAASATATVRLAIHTASPGIPGPALTNSQYSGVFGNHTGAFGASAPSTTPVTTGLIMVGLRKA
jgi:hypothetical protein